MNKQLFGASLSAALLPGLIFLAPPASGSSATVTVKVSKRQVDIGQTVAIRGQVSPSSVGQLAVLQRKAGKKWKRVAAKRLNKMSRYKFVTEPPKVGPNRYRVVASGRISPVRRVTAYRWIWMDDRDAWVDSLSAKTGAVAMNGTSYAHGIYWMQNWTTNYVEINLSRRCTNVVGVVGLNDADSHAEAVENVEFSSDGNVLMSNDYALGESEKYDLKVAGDLRFRVDVIHLTPSEGGFNKHGTVALGNPKMRCAF